MQKGYTLFEVIIVLSIISIISTISVLSLQAISDKKEQRLLAQLTNDLYLCQQMALSNAQSTNCLFINTPTPTFLIRQAGRIEFIREYGEHVFFQAGTMGLAEVIYNTKGNISKSGTMYVSFNGNRYSIVFLLGRGRFYVSS
ncbi:competence type IV pilus minor pilin ComGD [Bacillus sp. FJAT-45350]|uniref:competence type IV pilus minor pilin ComGD n=1 Tax=Bacillus sp. FJAT-45350 TaxID=2011014 RepID=UPI000BB8FCEF|nr:competence type IV pilus minor pilin ComGD [Bacillus sp. FJAT-45350]